MTSPDEPLLDKPQAMAMLNIGQWHLEALIKRREIPIVKVGRLVRFRKDDLANYLEANTIEAL